MTTHILINGCKNNTYFLCPHVHLYVMQHNFESNQSEFYPPFYLHLLHFRVLYNQQKSEPKSAFSAQYVLAIKYSLPK